MKKFLTITLIILVLLGAAGYAVWHFGTNIASEKIIDTVKSNLTDENLEEIKTYIENDPKVQQIVSEVATTNPDTLPFQTKEEATRVLITKVGVNRLLDIQEQAQNGSINPDELLTEIEGKLSDEEITAFKYVLYKELYK
ncbi:Phenylalanyl-tRNA synthetase subunit beta OS=Ureibacillus acetophenoni OX=614649 GN=SAMN05877842_110171 PE=4 SV=1 [Ureibacillus acetophenoni]